MKASPIFTPVRARTASSVLASATVMLMGFSQRTCLPASAALAVQGTCNWLGKRIVDGVDLGVGQQLLVGAVRLGNAELRRCFFCFGQIA